MKHVRDNLCQISNIQWMQCFGPKKSKKKIKLSDENQTWTSSQLKSKINSKLQFFLRSHHKLSS